MKTSRSERLKLTVDATKGTVEVDSTSAVQPVEIVKTSNKRKIRESIPASVEPLKKKTEKAIKASASAARNGSSSVTARNTSSFSKSETQPRSFLYKPSYLS
jgi:hypothetical protein